ncbi:MAG: pilus (MSHA type) biogenesis protein MshL [Desulfobacteraceae bacterium]|nr:pilus (MSHA type) biogenesis protein MshL [Desulfobacteraceae bacterium]
MKYVYRIIIFCIMGIFLSNCTHLEKKHEKETTDLSIQTAPISDTSQQDKASPTPSKPSKTYEDISMNVLETESNAVASNITKRRKILESKQEKSIDIEPVIPAYDPLEDQMVSFSMVDESLKTILYLLADVVSMNLIVANSINDQEEKVTLHFQNVSAKTVLNELAERFDLNYKVSKNIIKIYSLEERIFTLNFLDTNVETSFEVGGDVLGASGDETIEGLSGSVKLSGTGSKKGNSYDLLEEMINNVKSDKGIFSVNRLSGSLYIKDKPSVVKTISKLVNHYKEMLDRQILIEARIIEVTLSDGFEYGIDWKMLRTDTGKNLKLSEASWDLQSGLVLNGIKKHFDLTSAITVLETFGDVKIISNPTIRARHGNPAIISVGDSISYKKSVDITTNTTSTTSTDQTVEVEISSVFDGLILGVIPFIEENGKINLLINPVKSDVDSSSIENPENIGNGESISLPKVGIKEINTTIAMNNGDVVMLGGLISKEENKKDQEVPLLGKIPVLGYLFKSKYLKNERKELVIILSVNII